MSRPNFFIRFFVVSILVFTFFAGCSDDDGDSTALSVYGTWKLAGYPGYEEKLVITSSRIEYYNGTVATDSWPTTNYIAEIISLSHDMFNNGESTNSTHGYAVIRYLYADNSGWGESNTYNIFRWKKRFHSGVTNYLSFSVGYNAVGTYPNNTNQVFSNAAAAEAGATVAAGYFGAYSESATNYVNY